MNNYKRILAVLIFFVIFGGAVFAGEVKTNDTIGFFRNIHVAPNDTVGGSVVALFGNARIEGTVYGDVVTIFGNIDVVGNVEGSTVAVLGGVKLGPQGVILEDVVQILGGRIQEEPGSHIGGSRVSFSTFALPGVSGIGNLFILILGYSIIKLLLGYVMSILAVLIFPDRFQIMARAVTLDMGRKFIIGIMIVIGFYVLAAMLVMVVIGIPFFLLVAPIMGLLGFTGNTAVKLAIGKKMGKSLGRSWSPMMELFVGTLLYGIVDLTIVGKSATFLAKVVGIGAVIDSKLGTHRPPSTKLGFISLDKKEDFIDERK